MTNALEGDMKIKVDPSIRSTAVFSECGTYRYQLVRERDVDLADDDLSRGTVNFLLCNPSVAGIDVNDPTVLRTQKRAFKYGIRGRRFSRLIVTNLFGVISTDPKGLGKLPDPIGPDNDRWIIESAKEADILIVGWGDVGARYKRPGQVIKMLQEHGIAMFCLGVNESGHPVHPLMLSYKQDAIPYEVSA